MTEAGDTRVTALQRGGGLAAWRQIADALAGEIRSGALAAGAGDVLAVRERPGEGRGGRARRRGRSDAVAAPGRRGLR
jgi:hypothetical protein